MSYSEPKVKKYGRRTVLIWSMAYLLACLVGPISAQTGYNTLSMICASLVLFTIVGALGWLAINTVIEFW